MLLYNLIMQRNKINRKLNTKREEIAMEYDTDKVDDMALALLYLTHFREGKDYPYQAWKGLDWDVLYQLHEKGYIEDAKNKKKSIVFTDEGFERSKRLFQKHFGIDEQET